LNEYSLDNSYIDQRTNINVMKLQKNNTTIEPDIQDETTLKNVTFIDNNDAFFQNKNLNFTSQFNNWSIN
jgi:hypothetical protein